jgi:peptide/nickel transport system substrate-binding protein
MRPTGGRNPRTVRLIVVVVALVIILAGVATYVILTRAPSCSLSSSDPLIFDQPEKPDTLDPHVTFSTPGWGIVQQVYQSLVNYNGTSYTTFVPVLAKSWSVSADGYNYTFVLRQNVHFSNGDPFNAYVMWYSLYRAIVMNQAGSFILQENFWLPGLNYYSDANDSANATAWMINNLNTFDFSNPSPSALAVMEDANNSFQVVDANTIILHMGYGYLGTVAYANLLASIAGPIASAVDPIVISANGGVAADINPWMASHMVGTGPFVVQSYTAATGYLLAPDPSYWAISAAAAEPWNNIIQPAKARVQINFQTSAITAVQDIKSGAVAGVSFAYVGPSQVNDLKAAACVQANLLDIVYGSTAGGWWIYMNQNTAPFTDIHVRAAVVHAINYDEIIAKAFNGYAQRWVGPVPPGYEYYNPNNLKPYEYNLTLARAEMNQSAWPLPGGFPTPINYMYLKLGDWAEVALLLQADLAKIGINIVPVGINNIDDLYTEQGRDQTTGECISQTSFGGGPFPIGQEFYTSDYIAPDDWTQNNAISYGSANDCMAAYVNATMDNLVIAAAGETNPTLLRQYYSQITQLMYDNYTVAWLVVPDQFQIANVHLQGYVTNPMGAALPFVVTQNTMRAG